MACCRRRPGIGNTAAVARRIFFRHEPKPAGGHLKVLSDRMDDRVAAARRFLRVSENFFWPAILGKNAAKFTPGGVGRSEMR